MTRTTQLFNTCGADRMEGTEEALPTDFSFLNILPEASNLESIKTFATSLREVLQDKRKYKVLLNLTGNDAQTTLDELQMALESNPPCDADRVVIMKAMTRLARRSGLYPRRFRITEPQIIDSKPIGEGSYGKVWRALLGDRIVCVKILLQINPHEGRRRLLKAHLREGLIWAQISFHPNIAPFYGIPVGGVHGEVIGLVSEWMPNGNVVEYLKKNPFVPRMALILDIATGLQYLHSLSIVHGDIKGINILIDSQGHARLADFGLADVRAEEVLKWSSLSSGPSQFGGTLRWQAPELLCGEVDTDSSQPNTTASDVYSFACTMYEILSGRVPFHEIQTSRRLLYVRVTQPDMLPARRAEEHTGSALTDNVWQVMEDGWGTDPKQRPRMGEMLERLEK